MEGSPNYGMEDMEDGMDPDMMGDMDDYGQEGDPMDGSGQYGNEEYGEENVSYRF